MSEAALSPSNGFDRLARPYRWLEYLTFGRALERCRESLLPELLTARNALVLGDGDGRFLAHLLARNPLLSACVVDASAAMLELLAHRCGKARSRLTLIHGDALDIVRTLPPSQPFDLVVTHFFLDCLSQPQLEDLVCSIAARAQTGTRWVLSEFHVARGWRGLPARVLVASLYRAFRLLTGLPVKQLPDHAGALRHTGFTRIAYRQRLAGMLVSELWELQAGRSAEAIQLHL